jgi:hypothetical protein
MVKLKSGREVELKPLNAFQRLEWLDMILEYHRKGMPGPGLIAGKLAVWSLGVKDTQLDEYPIEDILEIGDLVSAELQKTELDKKK